MSQGGTMLNRLNNRGGFTLIELVMIIIILGILAAVAIPKYIDLQTDAENSAIRGLYGQITSAYGITIADLKRNPSISELNNNLTGDPGSLQVNSGSIINAITTNNTIKGVKRQGVFIVTGDPITSIGSLTLSNVP